MKTYKKLYEKLYTTENLTLAFRKARKGKSKKNYVVNFESNLDRNIAMLKIDLKLKRYYPNKLKKFIVRDPKTYGLTLSLSNIEKGKPKRVIKTKCFWHYTSEAKVPTIIIGCPVTFPPDKVYGRMLSGMGVPDILGTEGTFTFYTTEALAKGKDVGGKVFQIKKSTAMTMNLIGPRVATLGGKTKDCANVIGAVLEMSLNLFFPKAFLPYQK